MAPDRFETMPSGFARAQRQPATRSPAPKVTILLPARNEEAGLAATLAALPLHKLESLGYRADVLVVDGHSTDRTREIAQAWGARVVLQDGKGKGLAVRSALRHIDADYVVMLDSDHTYPEDEIPRFVETLAGGKDVVIGSRFRGAIADGAMSRFNRIGNKLLSFLATVLYRRRVSDVCTGMWGFRTSALERLPLKARHFEIEAELFALSVKSGLRIAELPIPYRCRIGETKLGSLRDGLAIGFMLLLALPRRAAARPGIVAASAPLEPRGPRSGGLVG